MRVIKDNRAISYISQSHLWGECRATLYTEQESYSEENELPPLDIHNGEHIQQSCHAGMAIAHHPLCCHMSPFNESEQHRRAWSLTFITPDVVWDPEHAAHPINYQLSPSQKEVLDAPCFPRFHHSLEHRI